MTNSTHISIGCMEVELAELAARQRVIAHQLEQIFKRAPASVIDAIRQVQADNCRMIESMEAARTVMAREV